MINHILLLLTVLKPGKDKRFLRFVLVLSGISWTLVLAAICATCGVVAVFRALKCLIFPLKVKDFSSS